MSDTISIREADAQQAIDCAKYLADLATRFTKISEKLGFEEDVENNLACIVSVLEGNPIPLK